MCVYVRARMVRSTEMDAVVFLFQRLYSQGTNYHGKELITLLIVISTPSTPNRCRDACSFLLEDISFDLLMTS